MVHINDEGWRGSSLIVTRNSVELMIAQGPHLNHVADAVIKAKIFTHSQHPLNMGV
jgi:hypothetical protein